MNLSTFNPKMHSGDSLYKRMTTNTNTAPLFREPGDAELEHKTRKVADKVSESLNIIANEPSLAFFRVQEHVRKSLPQLTEQKHAVQDIQQYVQGACFDTEYATNAVRSMHSSAVHFQNIQDLLKNAMFMKQQITYEGNRRVQEKTRPSMYPSVMKDASHISGVSMDHADSGVTQQGTDQHK